MATKKAHAPSLLGDILSKVNDSFNVSMYDNGFMVEVSGQSFNGDYKTAKVIANDPTELLDIIMTIVNSERTE